MEEPSGCFPLGVWREEGLQRLAAAAGQTAALGLVIVFMVCRLSSQTSLVSSCSPFKTTNANLAFSFYECECEDSVAEAPGEQLASRELPPLQSSPGLPLGLSGGRAAFRRGCRGTDGRPRV